MSKQIKKVDVKDILNNHDEQSSDNQEFNYLDASKKSAIKRKSNVSDDSALVDINIDQYVGEQTKQELYPKKLDKIDNE